MLQKRNNTISRNKGRILLIDDTPESIDVMRAAFEDAGYDVFIATNGRKALRQAELVLPDLILLDILMPGMNGYETCMKLKKHKTMRNIPIIFISALADVFDKIKGFDAGAVDYIAKPIEMEELLSRAETHLTIGRLQKKLMRMNEDLEARVLARTETLNRLNLRLKNEITDHKQTAAALREKNAQLAILLESLPIVVFACRPGGDFGISFVSSGIEEITGYKSEQFVEKSSFWMEHVVAQDRARVVQWLESLLRRGENSNEYRFMVADGSHRWFSDMRQVIRDANGCESHITGIWRDITEEIRLRQESEQRLQLVVHADKLASLGEMVVAVTHEINNPVSFIKYNLPVLEETWQIVEPVFSTYAEKHPEWRRNRLTIGELCQDMAESIQAIKIGSDRISKVILDFKRFARKNESSEFQNVNLNEVIEMAFTIVGVNTRKSIASIDVCLDPELPDIKGHSQKLEQVVINLVVNAVNALSDRADSRLVVATRYIERLRSVALSVEDNGKGMTPEVSRRIFEPFFTTRRDDGGTGLGLSVSFYLVAEHRGVFGVLSRPGMGTRFTIFLPVSEKIDLSLRSLILCVDDNEDNLSRFRECLMKARNIPFESLNNSELAVSYLETHPEVDIILIRIDIRGLDGRDFLHKIKRRFPLLTVIRYAGDGSVAFTEEDGIADTDCILEDPGNTLELIDIIEKIQRQQL